MAGLPRDFDLSELPAPVHEADVRPILSEILGLLERGDRERFEALYETAAAAMSALGEFDLTGFEEVTEQTDAYGVWEKLAPVVSNTLDTLHQLLAETRKHFPARPKTLESQVDAAAAIVDEFCSQVQNDVTEFKSGMQKPENMSDRWRLLAYLSFFRGKFRAAVGDMIYGSATVFAKVTKEDVVPFYKADLECAIVLRRGLADLKRTVDLHEKIEGGEKKLLVDYGSKLLAALERFSGQEAYKYLRVPDRRIFVETRAALRDGVQEVDAARLEATFKRFDAFMDTLQALNARSTLKEADRTAADAAGASLDAAALALKAGLMRARIEVDSALSALERVVGRDEGLDEVLDLLRETDVKQLGLFELTNHVENLQQLIENLKHVRL